MRNRISSDTTLGDLVQKYEQEELKLLEKVQALSAQRGRTRLLIEYIKGTLRTLYLAEEVQSQSIARLEGELRIVMMGLTAARQQKEEDRIS